MKPYIFVDLDETLIHTYDGFETPTKDAQSVFFSDGSEFKTSVRMGAGEFLSKLREKGDVFMLTVATKEYAQKMNEKFKFGFTENEIYSREDIATLNVSLPPRDRVFLFDNLRRKENTKKITFLRKVCNNEGSIFNNKRGGDKITYVQVQEYDGGKSFPFSDNIIEQLTKDL